MREGRGTREEGMKGWKGREGGLKGRERDGMGKGYPPNENPAYEEACALLVFDTAAPL